MKADIKIELDEEQYKLIEEALELLEYHLEDIREKTHSKTVEEVASNVEDKCFQTKEYIYECASHARKIRKED